MKLAYLAAAALAPALASAADFAGTWKLDNTFIGKISVIPCTLVQSGNALSGSCKPDAGIVLNRHLEFETRLMEATLTGRRAGRHHS